MEATYERILADIQSIRVYNTHCHHRRDAFYTSMSLDKILKNSYVTFTQKLCEPTPEARRVFLERNRYNTYFLWLERAIQRLYDFPESITADNWDVLSDRISAAYAANPDLHLKILREDCRYDGIVQDTFWQPGSDHGHPDLFNPTYRISMFTYALDDHPHDHDNCYLYEQCPRETPPADLDAFIAWMRQQIEEKKAQGCTAIKSALAYARDLHYEEEDRDAIARIYHMDHKLLTADDKRRFSNYVIFQAAKIAAELDMPFQHHTGLGGIDHSNAMQLKELIEKNPDTQFVLFHGSYPWLEDIYALVHNLPNTYADMCWLPIISTSAAERMCLELLEVGQTHRIHWGCDTWTSEESYGALLAMELVLARVLSKQVDAGFYNLDDAAFIARRILRDNTQELYHL